MWQSSKNDHLSLDQKIRLNQHITEGGWFTVTDINSWKIYSQGQFRRVQTNENELSHTRWGYDIDIGAEYKFSDKSIILYNLGAETSAAQLGQLDESESFIDDWVATQGNFHLKSVWQMKNSFMWDFNNEHIHSVISIDHFYSRHPINGTTYRETDRFVRKWDNQDYKQNLKLKYWIEWKIIPEYFSTNYMIEYQHIVSKGKNYCHKGDYSDFLFNVIGMYKNWMLLFEIRELGNGLDGESRSFGKKEDSLMLTYQYRNLSLGAILFCFLNQDYRNNRRKGYNEWTPYEEWNKESPNQLILRLSYYLSWGKQKEGYNQRVKNEDTG